MRARCTPGISRHFWGTSCRTAGCDSNSRTRSSATRASLTRATYGNHERRLRIDAVRVRAGDVHRARGDPPRLPPPVYAADVADQRDLGHRSGRVDRGHRRGPSAHDPHPRRRRAVRLDDQHRQRLHDHRPHAQDVQEAVMHLVGELSAVLATALFIFALYWMNDPKTARRGVIAGVTGMSVAVLATWFQPEIVHHAWVVGAIAVGFLVGVPLSRVPLTTVPQRTALSHAFGGLAAGLVGTAEYFLWLGGPATAAVQLTPFRMSALVAEVILGFLTFTGSLMAAGKLQEVRWIPQRPVTYPGQNVVNIGVLAIAVGLGVAVVLHPGAPWAHQAFLGIAALALSFGVLLIIPIGGAAVPTVISILIAYAGLSAVAMGFVLDSKLLVTAGALDGSSGLILSIIMCRAMNRSFTNVLFGAFGKAQPALAAGEQKPWKQETVEGAAQLLEQARNVVIIPGYGMAVAQAQHKVRELYDALTKRGVDVTFGIHPVAGRMPGHMNVLLAEADIPYDKLLEMDQVNGDIPQTDVALIIGANDVTNPAARTDTSSPIYGMPILDVDKARTVMVIKRSMSAGFAGIDNPLYVQDNTWMLFGDAKAVLGELVKQFGGGGIH